MGHVWEFICNHIFKKNIMVSKRTSSCFLANATQFIISVYYLSTASSCPEALSMNDLHSVLLTLLPSHPLLGLNLY